MTKSQAKVLAGTLIAIASLLLFASFPFGIEYTRAMRACLFPPPPEPKSTIPIKIVPKEQEGFTFKIVPKEQEGLTALRDYPSFLSSKYDMDDLYSNLFIFTVLAISAVSLAGLGLFILKGRRKNNKGGEK